MRKIVLGFFLVALLGSPVLAQRSEIGTAGEMSQALARNDVEGLIALAQFTAALDAFFWSSIADDAEGRTVRHCIPEGTTTQAISNYFRAKVLYEGDKTASRPWVLVLMRALSENYPCSD